MTAPAGSRRIASRHARALADGATGARLREQLRVIAGRGAPVTPRELLRACRFVEEALEAADPMRRAAPAGPGADAVALALATADLGWARREDAVDEVEALAALVRGLRSAVPPPETLTDVLDIGAYQGGLIDALRTLHGDDLDYLAIDLEPSSARGSLSVTKMDATRLTLEANSVRQVYCLDVLEHLHGREQVARAVAEGVRVASEYAYFECPDFGDVDLLRSHGLKWCWSDWTGHTMPVTRGLFESLVDELCLDDAASIGVRETVYDASHPQLVRLDAPRDTTIASPWIDGHRPAETRHFERAIHHRVVLEIRKNPFVAPLWSSPAPPSDLDPRNVLSIPDDMRRLAALLSTLVGAGPPLTAVDAELAVVVAGKIFEGAPPELAMASSPGALPQAVSGLLELYARGVRNEGKPDLAGDLRDCAATIAADPAVPA